MWLASKCQRPEMVNLRVAAPKLTIVRLEIESAARDFTAQPSITAAAQGFLNFGLPERSFPIPMAHQSQAFLTFQCGHDLISGGRSDGVTSRVDGQATRLGKQVAVEITIADERVLRAYRFGNHHD
jgi:hypothetical protein